MRKVMFFMLVFLFVLFCVFATVFTSESGKEFYYKYRAEIFTTTGSGILLVLIGVFKVVDYISTKCLLRSIEQMRDPVINATNGMIDGYNDMKKGYEAMERVMAIVTAQNAFVVEALQTVYANSKNLPQGIKDVINLKYAKCLKAVGDDEMLKRLSETFRKEIDTVTNGESAKEENE